MDDHDAIGETEQTRPLRAPCLESLLAERDVKAGTAQNRSPSRKRPRLDSGSRSIRSGSADRSLSAPDKAVGADNDSAMSVDSQPLTPTSNGTPTTGPALTPSRVTINVRERLEGAATPTSDGRHPSPERPSTPNTVNGMDGSTPAQETNTDSTASPQSQASSPVIEIADEASGQTDEIVAEIHLDNDDSDEERVAALLYRFPYGPNGQYCRGAELIADEQERAINFEVLAHLDTWLQELLSCISAGSRVWSHVFYEHCPLWETIIKTYSKLFNRGVLKQQNAIAPDVAEKYARTFLTTFMRLSGCILQVDAQFLEFDPPLEVERLILLSPKIVNAARLLLRDDKGFIAKVIPTLGVDPNELRAYAIKCFIEANAHTHIARIICLNLSSSCRDEAFLQKIVSFISFTQSLSAYAAFYLDRHEGLPQPMADDFATKLLEIFDTAERQLLSSLDKQQDVLNLDMRKMLFERVANILNNIFNLSPRRSSELFLRMTGSTSNRFEEYQNALSVTLWKLKLMQTYMTKARMDLRLLGVDTLAKELVDFYNGFKINSSSLRTSDPGPLLCFVADFLLREKITNFLFGVATHPQLIARSHNVIGFLVITNNFSRQQAELMFRTIMDGQDPRVVAATLSILASLIKQLTNFEENIMISEMFLSESVALMSPQATELWVELLAKLQQGYQDYQFRIQEPNERFLRVPPELCIELMRVFSPTRPQTGSVRHVYDQASEVLTAIGGIIPANIRTQLYERCIVNMQNASEDGASSSQAINNMLRHEHKKIQSRLREMRLAQILLENFCKFVEDQRTLNIRLNTQQLSYQILPRLDLIWFIVPLDEQGIDQHLLKCFWSHLVGNDALSNTARDVAWQRLSTSTFNPAIDKGFLERHQELLLPTQIEPKFFTAGFFQFLQKLATTRRRSQALIELNPDGTINMPGLDLIWDAFLRAPKGVGENSTLQYLIARYLEDSWIQRTSRDAVEATHVALVDQSITRLKLAYTVLRQRGSDAVSGIDSGTGVLTSVSSCEEAESTFLRMMTFLKRFLLHIRTLKDYRPKVSEVIDLSKDSKPEIRRGMQFSLKCEINRQGQKAASRILMMGTHDTCRQLYRRICSMLNEYNVTSFQVIGSGRRLSLCQHPRMTLEDAGITRSPMLIIRDVASGEEARNDYIIPSQQSRSVFEQQLVDRLDVFYKFLDGDCNDVASSSTYMLLKHLPRYQTLKEMVCRIDTPVSELFPSGQVFKISYTLDCLRDLLEADTVNEEFLIQGTRLVESLLPDDKMLASAVAPNWEFVCEIVSLLYDFFIAGQVQGVNVFADVSFTTRRLIAICAIAIPVVANVALAWDCYELILDLLSKYENAWHEFKTNSKVAAIHQDLLLKHPVISVRRTTSQIIQRRLLQWGSASQVTREEFAGFLWSNVSNIILIVDALPQQAAEIFDIAMFLYKNLLSGEILALEQIQTFFDSWRNMLTSHVHHEIVGRDEADVIIRGLAALIRETVAMVPNIADNSTKIDLMESLWWKFLFQPQPRSSEEAARLASQIPALETETRTELVQLISTLATDDETVDILCTLLDGVEIQHKFMQQQIDRQGLLKSPAGYVGLKNLGQTCYMNSLITNLFMNPVFRAFILACAPLTHPNKSPLLYETQRLFSYMQNTYRGCASAEEFTKKIVTLTEERIDVREQMDVDEFMNTLFHRWEEQMPTTEHKMRLRSIYTGTTIQQIKSKECEHVSEREDTCLAIPCDVQGNANLDESLRAYTLGDVMEGDNKYKCERCDRLVDAVKRTCLKDIPNHLMLQLKRFAFDLETYSRNKINDNFEFPTTINMTPYTFEQLANPDKSMAEDLFELVGIIVHKGQAEHGHYVSYIRARPTPEGQAPTWLLFDDADVTLFDVNDLPEACYGGPSKDSGLLFASALKSYNAYMLFYQRKSTLNEHPWAPADSTNSQNVPIMPDMEEEINEDNRVLLRDYALCDDSTRELIRSLLRKLDNLSHNSVIHELQSKVLSLVWKYMTSIWARTKDLPNFEEAMQLLRSVCAKCNRCCYISLRWLIQSQRRGWNLVDDEDILRDMVLRITQPKVRQLMRNFILGCLKQLRTNVEIYGADISKVEPQLSGHGAISIITRLAQFIPDDLRWNLRAWEDYFGLLADIAALGPQESYVLILDGALTASFEALLCNENYSHAITRLYHGVNETLKRKAAPSYNQLIRLASILFNHVNMHADAIPEERAGHRLKHYENGGVPWTDNEETILLDFRKTEGGLMWLLEVFQKWNFESEDSAPSDIVRLLLNAKSSVVHGVLETFNITIKEFESRYADPFLRLATCIPLYLGDQALLEKFIELMKICSMSANGTNSPGEDYYDGLYCVRFWNALHQIAIGNLESKIQDPHFFDKHFIEGARDWAPPLLVYNRDYEVGRMTQRLVHDAFFGKGQSLVDDDVRDIAEQDEAVAFLFQGCERHVRMWQSNDAPPWRQFMLPLFAVMQSAVQFAEAAMDELVGQNPEMLREYSRIISRFEEVKIWFESLPVRSMDDLDLAPSNEFAGVGLERLENAEDNFAEASDFTEGSDDEMRHLLTVDADGS
ncbi:uncharacterized protein PV09_06560 [Verruconis gallopava]|uniref:USP domain-containing protein n=1 Tax=Verruconis gallopava TaxID=253628 RepID=A0A0D2A5R7_9PEZI|nr:uncharacterized protein PV09_06560 [Verruconis gallopava]KIW02063.1 hypothetical protein PV09_06560 [Verruconis gallopava]